MAVSGSNPGDLAMVNIRQDINKIVMRSSQLCKKCVGRSRTVKFQNKVA